MENSTNEAPIVEVQNQENWYARLQKKLITKSFYPLQIGSGATLGEMDIYFYHAQYKNEKSFNEIHYTVEDANVLVIHGNLNRKFDNHLLKIYKRMKSPVFVIQLGSNIILNDYCQSRIIGIEIPVDLYIPGNPPSPTMIISAFEKLKEKILGVKNDI